VLKPKSVMMCVAMFVALCGTVSGQSNEASSALGTVVYDSSGEIHDAASAGDLNRVSALLRDNPSLVLSIDKDGFTPLHLAAAKGHKDVAELLLANNAKVNAADLDGLTPLFYATVYDKKDVAEVLLANKANVNVKEKLGQTALIYAVSKGFADIVQLLLVNKADVNVETPKGQSVFYLAVAQGRPDLSKLLMEADGVFAELNRAIELRPTDPDAYIARGKAKSSRWDDEDGAIEDYTKAINLKTDAETYRLRAVSKFARATKTRPPSERDLDGAIEDCTKAIELEPTNAVAYLTRGMFRQGKGDVAGANADYEKAKLYKK
jgi:tetratricopeptide (TPR) repeat protein